MSHRSPGEGDGRSNKSDHQDDQSTHTMDVQTPQHPVPTMQGAFEESMIETMTDVPEPEVDKRYATADSATRRKMLLEQKEYQRTVAGKWKQKPGEKFHPLWKLVAQISFGMHLLSQGLAKSDEEVIKILQGHVDEIDGFLERTTGDFDLATTDIQERLRCLRLPLEHGDVFDNMLMDRAFRLAIVDGNEKIEHIVTRTSVALRDASKDVQKGLDATRALAKYFSQLIKRWPDRTEEQQSVYDAMVGNTEGWTRALLSLQSKGKKLSLALAELTDVIDEIQKRAGIASRKGLASGRGLENGYYTANHSSLSLPQRSTKQKSSTSSPQPQSPPSQIVPSHIGQQLNQNLQKSRGQSILGNTVKAAFVEADMPRRVSQKLKKRPPSERRNSTSNPTSPLKVPSPEETSTAALARNLSPGHFSSSSISPQSSVQGTSRRPSPLDQIPPAGARVSPPIDAEETDCLSPLNFGQSMLDQLLSATTAGTNGRSLSRRSSLKKEASPQPLSRNDDAQNIGRLHSATSSQSHASLLEEHKTAEEEAKADKQRVSRLSLLRTTTSDFLKSPSVRSSLQGDYYVEGEGNVEYVNPLAKEVRTKEVRFAQATPGKPTKPTLIDLPLRHYRSQDAINESARSTSPTRRRNSLKSKKTQNVAPINGVVAGQNSEQSPALISSVYTVNTDPSHQSPPSSAYSSPNNRASAILFSPSSLNAALSSPATDDSFSAANRDSLMCIPPLDFKTKATPAATTIIKPNEYGTEKSPSVVRRSSLRESWKRLSFSHSDAPKSPKPTLVTIPSPKANLTRPRSNTLTKPTPASKPRSRPTSSSSLTNKRPTSSSSAILNNRPQSSSSMKKVDRPRSSSASNSQATTDIKPETSTAVIERLLSTPSPPASSHSAERDNYPTDFASFPTSPTSGTFATLFPSRRMDTPLPLFSSPPPPSPGGSTLPAGNIVVVTDKKNQSTQFSVRQQASATKNDSTFNDTANIATANGVPKSTTLSAPIAHTMTSPTKSSHTSPKMPTYSLMPKPPPQRIPSASSSTLLGRDDDTSKGSLASVLGSNGVGGWSSERRGSASSKVGSSIRRVLGTVHRRSVGKGERSSIVGVGVGGGDTTTATNGVGNGNGNGNGNGHVERKKTLMGSLGRKGAGGDGSGFSLGRDGVWSSRKGGVRT
ncbi:hypothetical protein MMC25_003350 [Agyrium rufum]|nr:hypothetical protein [Agyrium rufum]